jgi:hypothetical protein
MKAADSEKPDDKHLTEFGLERYRYILQQIAVVNENVYRFLGIYQALATAIVGAALALFVGYRKWQIPPRTARSGILGLLFLETTIAAFAILLIVIGMLSWIDYRREEVELTDRIIHQGFRSSPKLRNSWRWYETYIIAFIAVSTAFMWLCCLRLILPGIK